MGTEVYGLQITYSVKAVEDHGHESGPDGTGIRLVYL